MGNLRSILKSYVVLGLLHEAFGTPVQFKSLGCWKDTSTRAVPQADGQFPTLTDNYKTRTDAIEKCATIAASLEYKVFAVQNGGWCATGPSAHFSYAKYGESVECREDGKGGPWANEVYAIDGWEPVEINDLGCWKDTSKRAIRSVDKRLKKEFGPYKSRVNAVEICAHFARSRGYEVFALQDGGWCATSPKARDTFRRYGPSTACKPDGKGGLLGNQVYELAAPPSHVQFTSIGCYKDTSDRAVPQADKFFSTLRDDYKTRTDAIEKCATIAASLGYKVFAVQNGGWCATGPSAHFSYAKYGQSVGCREDGKGGPWANDVYAIDGWEPVEINDLGCWKDTSSGRAIPSIDKSLEKEFGTYKSRVNAVEICAHHTRSRGYDVFAVQDGGWCATSRKARNTFRRYGPSTACNPDGKGGLLGNQVYELAAPPSRVQFTSIGCYKDTSDRAVPQADKFFSTLRDDYKSRRSAITKCASVAASLGYKVFAVQNGGWCATGPNAHLTFDKHGPSTACGGEGKGGPSANDVYGIDGWKLIELTDLGCWKDNNRRAIAGVERVLKKKYGPYKTREGAVQLCAEYAKSQGHTVFAVQDGGWCATSMNAQETFGKYGPSLDCAANGRGGLWANQVYQIRRPPSEVEYNYIGCFEDRPERAIQQADQRFSTLRDLFREREDAIKKCAIVAATLGYMVFAVQDDGWCAAGKDGHLTYDKYGNSSACATNGKGGPWANAVYGLNDFGTDYCLSSPCVRGECVSEKNGFECICPSTHSGPTCDEEINFCESTPCVHGECVMKTGGFECVCYTGFRGEICSEAIDYCKPNPCGAGVCFPMVGGDFGCLCPPGISGGRCEEVNVCQPSPCLHGECKRKDDGYRCTCDHGYTGENCDEEIQDACSSAPCKNNGTCTTLPSDYWCFCAIGFKGKTCEESEVFDVYSPCTRTCGGGSRYKVTKCEEEDITKCPRKYEGCNYQPCFPNPGCNRIGYEPKYKTPSECCTQPDRDQVCGVSAISAVSMRVIGGYMADLGTWPWAALLHIKSPLSTNATCGGSLIHTEWVLTAGHCVTDVDPDDVTVYLGTTNPILNHLSTQIIKAEKIILHEAFSFPVNDIALIKLEFHASVTKIVRPICLPMGEQLASDEKCFVAGWGVAKVENIARGIPSDDLMEVSIKKLDFDVCKSGYHGTSVAKFLSPKMLCAGSIDGGVDTCIGDSGGPLMCQRCESCTWFLAGVTSFGSAYCGEPGRPGIYTNVLFYEDWIKKYVALEDTKQMPSCA